MDADRVSRVVPAPSARDVPGEESGVSVAGGGCSGLSYRLLFEKEAGKQDRFFEHHGVKVIVDAKSYLYLNGTTVDYSDGLNGTGFTFTNPNATGTCGCGTSFHT